MNLFKIMTILALLSPLAFSGCSKAQEEGQHGDVKYAPKVNCVNNLKQIGFAFKMWARDHDEKFPFQLSTNSAGTLELISPDRDGFDSNAFLYLKTMQGDEGLATPLLLVCPQDKSKKAAASLSNLQPENVTYRFTASPNNGLSGPRILAVCPIDGNILYDDGTVHDKSGNSVSTP